jgi:hypothetical protein
MKPSAALAPASQELSPMNVPETTSLPESGSSSGKALTGGSTPATPQYEFTPEQDTIVGGLGSRMQFVGLVAILLGAVSLGAMIADYLRTGTLWLEIHGFVYLLVGIWSVSAGRSFQDVAQTKGRDINHLMDALKRLRAIYTLIAVLLLMAVLLIVIVWIFSVLDGEPGHWILIRGRPIR